MSKTLNVGIIGMGFIGRVHANAYHAIPLCFPAAPVTAKLSAALRSHAGTDEFLLQAGFDRVTTDLQEFLDAPLDLVDICTPNDLHAPEALAAIERGIPVYCEKPLARSLEEARRMADAAQQRGVLTHSAFVMRYLPAMRQMKALLQAGELGEVYTFRANMFHSSYLDTGRPMSWRLRNAASGGGAFADLGAHLLDMLRYLLGDVDCVRADARTFIRERPVRKGSEQRDTVDVDDWLCATLEMRSGAIGQVEAHRVAAGAAEDTKIEIYGSKGALAFHIAQPESVRFFSQARGQWLQGAFSTAGLDDGMRPIESIYPTPKFTQGMMTNVHLASQFDFLQCIVEGRPSALDFSAAVAVQEILEAAYISAKRGGEKQTLPVGE
ncbi:MAG TPA: Gfo/Idh/MocA family oxidoreductase [Anaerolineaceae bacterium]